MFCPFNLQKGAFMTLGADVANLECSSSFFKSGNDSWAYTAFNGVSDTSRNKVYRQMWVVKGQPLGDPEFGRNIFHNQHRHTASAQEKACAIDASVGRLKEELRENAIRLSANDGYYAWERRYQENMAGYRRNEQRMEQQAAERRLQSPGSGDVSTPQRDVQIEDYATAAGVTVGCAVCIFIEAFKHFRGGS
jgi:hypothetical protein